MKVLQIQYCEGLFAKILAEAESGDGRFMCRLRDHWIDGSERFDRQGEVLLGAFNGADLVGTAGVSFDPYEPSEGLGRVRHVYVLKACRGTGIAGTLISRLIEMAISHFRVLRLHTSNPAAARLYESLGFVRSADGRETHRLYL